MRLAVLCDLREEDWPSMELVADMLVDGIAAAGGDVARVQPAMRRRFSLLAHRKWLVNADRLINRLWDYPRAIRPTLGGFDRFHVADHSYAHLVHALPAGRAGVFCHDLDAFRAVLRPTPGQRPWAARLARHALEGLRKSALVFYSTEAVRAQIDELRLVPAERLVHAPYGVAPEMRADGPAVDHPLLARRPYLLHVGSCIPRKRIDVLLDTFARVRARRPDLTLLQIGGVFSDEQQRQIDRLGLGPHVAQARDLPRTSLAALYRAAELVLLTSDAEGFGMPVIEALACGSAVVASDLPVTREVGGDAVDYCRAGDPDAFAARVLALLGDPSAAPGRARRLARAHRYSWAHHAEVIVGAYRNLGAA